MGARAAAPEVQRQFVQSKLRFFFFEDERNPPPLTPRAPAEMLHCSRVTDLAIEPGVGSRAGAGASVGAVDVRSGHLQAQRQ